MASWSGKRVQPFHKPVNQRGQHRHMRDPPNATDYTQERDTDEAKERDSIGSTAGGDRFISPGGKVGAAREENPPKGTQARFPSTQTPKRCCHEPDLRVRLCSEVTAIGGADTPREKGALHTPEGPPSLAASEQCSLHLGKGDGDAEQMLRCRERGMDRDGETEAARRVANIRPIKVIAMCRDDE